MVRWERQIHKPIKLQCGKYNDRDMYSVLMELFN